MSTRCFIGIGNVDHWEGRYVHYDGYPTGVGATVWEGLQLYGPAYIADAMRHDWSSAPGMWEGGGVCYCCNYTDHSRECFERGTQFRYESLPPTIKTPDCGDDCIERHEPLSPILLSSDSPDEHRWTRWGYVVSEDKKMHVLVLHWSNGKFVALGSFPIDGEMPDWQKLQDIGYALDRAS